MRYARSVSLLIFFVTVAILAPAWPVDAQVTTATLFGIVRDATGTVLPGANVASRTRAPVCPAPS